MSDPRLLLDETLAELFGAEQRHPGPPAEARDRIRAAVAASIGAALATGSGAAAASTMAATAVGSGAVSTSTAATTSGAAMVAGGGLAAKLGGGALVVAALAVTAGGGVYVNNYELPGDAVVVAAPSLAPPTPPAGLIVDENIASLLAPPTTTTTTKLPTRHTPPRHEPTVEAPTPAVESPVVVDEPARNAGVAAERRQISLARDALSAGDGRQALALLDGHRVTWPVGQLVEEREALIVLSLGHLRLDDDARAAAAVFRARYPRSLFQFAIARAVP